MSRNLSLIVPLALSGCVGMWPGDWETWKRQHGNQAEEAEDADGDGYGMDVDCDDADPAVFPDADEYCDGVDNDCDGVVDEGEALDASRWYQDADGDGFGSEAVPLSACDQPSGYVAESADGFDCDDSNGEFHPGATEDDCEDPNDYNCDGSTGYADLDGDGWAACEECNDLNEDINPGADEIWYDGVDQDCDGNDDDQDLDGWSWPEDCDDKNSTVYPGRLSDHEGILMAYICPGTFTMGSPTSEVGRDDDEGEHEVTLTAGYYIGAYEVTQEEFEDLMGYQPSYYPGCDDCPTENMDWHEAAAFANAVSVGAGLAECYDCEGVEDAVTCELAVFFATPYDCEGYRLLTEAEWENAARAGTESAFSNGGNLVDGTEYDCGAVTLDNGTQLGDIAVYCGNDPGQTEEVGTKEPNSWGLHDMHGNVYEWCHDWHDEYDGDAVDPWGPAAGSFRVVRGGSWNGAPQGLRSANLGRYDPGSDGVNLGFRLARSE